MSALLAPGDALGLAKYDAACRAISEAKSVDEVKHIRDSAAAMRAYAKQAKNRQLEADAAEIRFRAERRIGELMAAQRDAGMVNLGAANAGWKQTRVEAPPTLAEAGIDKNLADRARKLAAIPETEFNGIVSDWRGRVEQENERLTVDLLKSGENHVRGTFGTGENEWYTPDEYLAAARDVLGAIDLDPATSAAAQAKVRASRFFTAQEDGLKQEWAGRIWLNPPYAQPHIADFVSKMAEEWLAGKVSAAIMLTHNYTDTGWFHEAAAAADAICFTRGRIRFHDADGRLAAPTQGQAFFYFGKDVPSFADRFRDIGFVVTRYWGEVDDG